MVTRRHLPVFAALLALCACTGNELPAIGASSPAETAAPAATASLLPTEATPDKPGFDPFSERPATDVGKREVIANPPIEEVMKTGPLPEMALGRADAPVTIIQYASMTCPYCRKFDAETFPILKREYIDTGKVRYILREFPIGHQSGLATIALRCAPPAKYFTLYSKLMAQQASWVSQEVRPDPIFKVAAQVGMTRQQFDTCRQNRGMIDGLKWVKDRGRTLGIIGTPNFFIQGKLVKSVIGIKEIREMVDPHLRVAAAPDAKAR